ncbi:Basic-leucine zipper (bZIP) transcription factor [Neofusicoccum parvum]|nr:Basic-leucine zipper (bZIP) transcription factor [Neofusicoccum parvum]
MAKSTPVPIYSLPNTNGLTLPPEDDWTRAKDRREKKKIQNRVAQRTYRQRMKARLGELQARERKRGNPERLANKRSAFAGHNVYHFAFAKSSRPTHLRRLAS